MNIETKLQQRIHENSIDLPKQCKTAPIKKHGITSPVMLSIIASGLIGISSSTSLALEPTPSIPTDQPPETIEPQSAVLPEIIIKYRNNEVNLDSKSNGIGKAAEISSYLQGQAIENFAGPQDQLGLEFVREMSGGAGVFELSGFNGAFAADPAETIQLIAEQISKLPEVEYAVLNQRDFIQQVNDPRFNEQWHYTKPQVGVNILPAWQNTSGENIKVAIIDTGYLPHADLSKNLLPGYDFVSDPRSGNDGDGRDPDASDPGDWISGGDLTWCPWASVSDSSWHGTHVAGTVAAVTNNNLGVAGLSYEAKIIPVRVLGKCGGTRDDIADGIRWAAGLPVPGVPTNPHPAHVINLSLGGRSSSCPPQYQTAINDAVGAGTTVIVAAGNSNADANHFTPANCANVITVASTNREGGRAYYSNFGSAVDIAAPGGETYSSKNDGVLSTLNTGKTNPKTDSYGFYQGTSMASPHVAGVTALLYAIDGNISPAEVLTKLKTSAKPFPNVPSRPCTTYRCGAGIVDANAAADETFSIGSGANLLDPE